MIVRSNKKRWTTVDNVWVKDPTLSAKAKGILIYILSLPDDWDLRMNELVTHFTDGIDGVRSGMKELSMHRYIDGNQRRDDTGKVIGWDYTIFENPDEPNMENPNMAKPTLLNTKEKPITKLIATAEQSQIIAYLNKKLSLFPPKGFKDTNQQTLKLLNARLKDYTKGDIIAVIDAMCVRWLGNEWEFYLRPQTLFNVNKFEGYVSAIEVEGSEHAGVNPLEKLK